MEMGDIHIYIYNYINFIGTLYNWENWHIIYMLRKFFRDQNSQIGYVNDFIYRSNLNMT